VKLPQGDNMLGDALGPSSLTVKHDRECLLANKCWPILLAWFGWLQGLRVLCCRAGGPGGGRGVVGGGGGGVCRRH
jgi:hypothetical protein